MGKPKTVIWGMGSGYRKREEAIKRQYDIVAYTDNSGKNSGFTNYISPQDLPKMQYDIILVCSKPYYLTIKYQLMQQYQIAENKICSIGEIPCDTALSAEKTIISHISQYEQSNQRPEFQIEPQNMWLISSDYDAEAGVPKEHYFAQDIWAAKKIYQAIPTNHYDIGSRLDGFLAHLLIFCDHITYIDIRPLPENIPGLHFMQGDATDLENIEDDSIESLSSLHAIEHFGLGRYGDPIDSEACFKAMKSFQRVLAKGGKLYLGVPIGPQDSVVFNAHRIFNPMTIIRNFNQLKLVDFSYVDRCSTIKVPLDKVQEIGVKISNYSCGLFEFVK